MKVERHVGSVLKSTITTVSKITNYVGVVFLVLMMLATTADVVLRSIFNTAVLSPYTFEAVEFMMVILIFFGLSYCELQKGNITVDLLVSRLSTRIQLLLDAATYGLTIAFVLLLIWRSVAQALFVREAGTHATALGFPIYIFMLVIAFGCFLLCLSLIINLVQRLTGQKKA